jgi:Putative auto-transporter adhesin, head GIN domain
VKLYYSLLTAIAILWGALSPAAVAQPALPSPQATRMPQKLAEFTAISVRGPVKLTLEQTPEDQQNFFQITGEQRSPVSVSVKNGTLYIQAPEDDPSQISTARVGITRLNQLMVDGGASVISKKFTSSSLSIDANTTGSIELLGMVTLDRLLSSGSGPIHIQWIDSPRLRIDGSNKSQIELAGVAGAVEMRLRDESQFQGKYLRIDQVFIQTKDFSTAKLLVNDSLRAFAYDHSNIYYYKRPAELTEFTAGSGNILQLGWGQ